MTTSVGLRRVGVRELKAHASELLRDMGETGEGIVITVRGRAVAQLAPFADSKPAVDGLGGQWGAYPDDGPFELSDFEEMKHEWKREWVDGEFVDDH